MSQRTDRIDELLRQEIGQALEREVADPAIGFVTITEVETSPDLSHARVWASVIGDDARRKEALAALRRAMPYVRRGLGGKLRLRRIPELDVRLDDSAQRGTRVLRILDELEKGNVPNDDGTVAESLPTPVPRVHHEGDAPEPAPAQDAIAPEVPPASARAARRPRRQASTRGPESADAPSRRHAGRPRRRR